MRADRLLSILIPLQSRDKLTADDLAWEPENSPRNIYRDMDALSIAGLPFAGILFVGALNAMLNLQIIFAEFTNLPTRFSSDETVC